MTAKTTTIRMLYVHVVLNCASFQQIPYHIVSYALHFIPVTFFPKYHFLLPATAKYHLDR